MAVEAVIYDFFGVLCLGSRSYVIARCDEDKRGVLHELFRQADYGYITAEEFSRQGAHLLRQTVEEFNALMAKYYVRDDAMLESIRKVRKTHKTALLSNANDAVIWELFTNDELDELFDEVVVSSSVGMVKPNPDFFVFAATRLELLPEECIMIDDMESNIKGAVDAGMQGIVFWDQRQYEQELQKLGVNA